MARRNFVRIQQMVGPHAFVTIDLTSTDPVKPDQLSLMEKLAVVLEEHVKELPAETST
jgi:hypothetical protein